MFRDLVIRVLSEYQQASSQPLANHPLATFIRSEFKSVLEAVLESEDRYIVKGSAGQGNWGKVPWVATFDILITDTAQEGFYLTYLFKSDMSGVYLNLNQGVTDIEKRYKAKAKDVLRIKAADFVAQLGPLVGGYNTGPIVLGPDLPTTVALYEQGSICSVFYSIDNIPTEEVLLSDYRAMIDLYSYLVDNDVTEQSINQESISATEEQEYEDTTKKENMKELIETPN